MVPGTAGNVSVRSGDAVAITPTGAVLADLQAAQVAVVDLRGNHLAGELAATSELALHLAIYATFDAGAVVHTHAPASTAVACVLDELPCIHYQMLALGGAVPVAPYATFGTEALAASVVTTLGGRPAALMANHGAITQGPTLAKALETMEVLEWACDLYRRALAFGEPRVLTGEQIEAVITHAIESKYGQPRPSGP
jgi:L-fuculose-phosphate aldolase